MSQQNSNSSVSVSLGESSLHNDYAFFISEDTKYRLELVSNSMRLIDLLLDGAADGDNSLVEARQISSLIYLVRAELDRAEAELKTPGVIFSEYQAVHGINLIQKYGEHEIIKALDLLSKGKN
ncbi:hypothetical protein JX83_02450 [Salmonella enterica]|nr:hypothetical protein [Salmonella enterica]